MKHGWMIWLIMVLLSGNLVAETSAYQTILQYARIKQLKQYVEKEQLLYSLVNRYIEETGRTPSDADSLITYFDLPESTSIFDSFAKNVGDGKIVFSLENNTTLNISNVLGNLNAVYGSEVGGQLLDYYRKASDRSAVASVVGDNNVSYPVSESAKGVLRIHSGLDSENAVMLSQKEFAEKQGEGFTEEEKSKTYYIPTGKGNVDVRIWSEEGWQSLGSVWDLNKGEILVDSEEELAQVHAFKGMKALMISGSSATENVYTGKQWVTFGSGGGGGTSDLGDLNISMGQQFVGHATLEDIVQEIFDKEAGSRAILVDFSSDHYRAALNYDVATHGIVQMEKRDISIDDVSAPHWFYPGSEDGKVSPLYAIDSQLDDETAINDFVDVLVDGVGVGSGFYLYSKNCYFDDDFSAVGEARYLGRVDEENQFLYIAQGFIKLVRTYDCINMPRSVQVFGEVSNIFYKNAANDYWANDAQVANFIGELENEEGNVTIVTRSRSRLGEMTDTLSTLPDADGVAKLRFFTVDEADCDASTCYYYGVADDNGYDSREGYRFKYLPGCEQFNPSIKHQNCLVDYIEVSVGALGSLTDDYPVVFADGKVLFREGGNYFYYENNNLVARSGKMKKCLAVQMGSRITCSKITSLPSKCQNGECGDSEGMIRYAGSNQEGVVIETLGKLSDWYPDTGTKSYFQNRRLTYQENRHGGYWYTDDFSLVVAIGSIEAIPADRFHMDSEIYLVESSSTQPELWSYTKSEDYKEWGAWIVKNHATKVKSCQKGCFKDEQYCQIGEYVYQWDRQREIYQGIDKNGKVADAQKCREYELLEEDVDDREGEFFTLELGRTTMRKAKSWCSERNMRLPTEEETRYLDPHIKGDAWTANRYGSVWNKKGIKDVGQKSHKYVKCVYSVN